MVNARGNGEKMRGCVLTTTNVDVHVFWRGKTQQTHFIKTH